MRIDTGLESVIEFRLYPLMIWDKRGKRTDRVWVCLTVGRLKESTDEVADGEK